MKVCQKYWKLLQGIQSSWKNSLFCESPAQLCRVWLGSYIPWKCQTEFLIFFYFYGIHKLVFTSLFSARKATGFAWTCAKKQHSIIRAGKCELCLLLLREYLVGQWKFKCPVDCFICICREKLVQQMNNAKLFFFFPVLYYVTNNAVLCFRVQL